MARKSNAQIARELAEKNAEIDRKAEDRVSEMMPSLVASITAQVMQSVGVARAEAGTADPGGGNNDQNFARHLASAIVQASDPKNKMRMVSPEIVERRKVARDQMVALLVDLRARGVTPTYTIRTQMWLDDTLVDPQWRDDSTKKFNDTVIYWDRPPNEGMVPNDENAAQVFGLFQQSIGSAAAEGLPDAPWLRSDSPWVFSKEGIVKGRPNVAAPEVAEPGKKIFNDPRVPGQSSAPEQTHTHVLGKSAPPVIETAGV